MFISPQEENENKVKSNSQIDFGITDLFFAFFFVRHGSSLKVYENLE